MKSRPIDFWYDRPLYGKIDRKENPVTVKLGSLEQLPSDKGTHVAVDFVAAAFADFRSLMANKIYRKRVNSDILTEMEPKRAYVDFEKNYLRYLDVYFDVFTETDLSLPEISEKIFDYDDYIEAFFSYATTHAEVLPITPSGFLLSSFCSPLVSGLVIEIEAGDHSTDSEKVSDFIRGKNFELYSEYARRFGFYVDKNAPWRLVANLASPQMQNYFSEGLVKRSKSASNVFDVSYDRLISGGRGYDMLMNNVAQQYERYIERNPHVKKIHVHRCGQPFNKYLATREKRPQYASPAAAEKLYIQAYYNYLVCKHAENGHPFASEVANKNMLFFLHSGLDIERKMRYIDTQITGRNSRRWWFDNISGLGAKSKTAFMENMALNDIKTAGPLPSFSPPELITVLGDEHKGQLGKNPPLPSAKEKSDMRAMGRFIADELAKLSEEC